MWILLLQIVGGIFATCVLIGLAIRGSKPDERTEEERNDADF